MSFQSLHDEFRALLALSRPPVAVSFLAAAPAGVRKFMGQVPSSCSFWQVAASAPAGKSAFVTTQADHFNCPIGSYTHRIDPPASRAGELEAVIGTMVGLGYLDMSEVAQIPRWSQAPEAIVYAQLGDAPVAPDVVIVTLPAQSAMLLTEAARAAGAGSGSSAALGRPTCMALPVAAAGGTTMSLGCIGNRVYTGAGDGELYVVLRGSDLDSVLTSLNKIAGANRALADYHGERKQRLSGSPSLP